MRTREERERLRRERAQAQATQEGDPAVASIPAATHASVADVLSRGDDGSRGRIAALLQQTQGNAAIQRLAADQQMIQRDWWESTKEFFGAETDEEKLLAELNDGLERAQKLCERSAIVVSDPEAAKRLETAGEHFGKITGAIGTGLSLKGTARDIANFIDAIKTLEKIKPEDMQGNKDAAKAFGKLFSSAGNLGKKLPEGPWSFYFEFLSNVGDFFVNMQVALDPLQRPSGRDQWKQIEGFQ